MGTDIHFYVERREPGGPWQSADKWTPNAYAEIDDLWPREVAYENSFYTDRNYDLFAILADVRNGRGFAGVDTGDGFVPLAAPRGLPDDLSPEMKAYTDSGAVDHTASWVTLAELLAYDWTRKTTKRGVVSPGEWAQWRDTGKPRGWSGGVNGRGVRHVTTDDMERAWVQLRTERGYPEERNASVYLRGESHSEEDKADLKRFAAILCGDSSLSPYCSVSWEVAYYEQVDDFLASVVPRLLRLGAPDDVRCVFWFDS